MLNAVTSVTTICSWSILEWLLRADFGQSWAAYLQSFLFFLLQNRPPSLASTEAQVASKVGEVIMFQTP